MTLEHLKNLEKIGQLKSHTTSREEVQRMLEAARRNLAYTAVEAISNETRFDSAYKAIMQLALTAMMANGFRPDTKKNGTSPNCDPVPAPHHRIAVGKDDGTRCAAP